MPPSPLTTAQRKRIAWFQRDRFGMFIHFGLYSATNLDCWTMFDQGMPMAEYVRRFEPRLRPDKCDMDEWMAVAKGAGCRYVVMGARHHEGYCLWDTATTSFNSVQRGPRRDFIAEFTAAARRAGLKVGIYYSLLDWGHQAYWSGPKRDAKGWAALVEMIHAQMRELMTDYGRVDIVWYDGGWGAPGWSSGTTDATLAEAWQSARLNRMVRRLQPGVIINNRSFLPEDFGTPEKVLRAENRPWELCDTQGFWWGASSADRNRKAPRELIERLLFCVSHGGNMLLNVGPKADGAIMPWQKKNMQAVGHWLQRHGEGIYGATGPWIFPFNNGLAPWVTTRRGTHLYIHLPRWPGRSFAVGRFHHAKLTSATLLDTGEKLTVRNEPTRDVIEGLPPRSPDPLAATVKVRFREGKAGYNPAIEAIAGSL